MINFLVLYRNKIIKYLKEYPGYKKTFILYSEFFNYSQLIQYDKNFNFNILKTCINPLNTNIHSYDNKYLKQNLINHVITLTDYSWNEHIKTKQHIFVKNNIEFFGGDENYSVETINEILEIDKLL